MSIMQIRNFFCLNDWNIRSFFIIIFSIYLIYSGSIALNTLGLSLPFLQQVTGFLLLLLVPGLLFLRVLRLHALGSVKTIAYAIGISLAILMFSGYCLNLVYPLFGFTKPLSFPFMLSTFSIIVAFLGLLSYLRDRDYCSPGTLNSQWLVTPISLVICAVPCVSIVGSYLIQQYESNVLSIVSILLIATLTLWFAIRKPQYGSPTVVLLIFSISISLLFGDLLISMYPRRLNVDGELFYLDLVAQKNYWDISLSGSANTVLSITTLGPIFSEMLGINSFIALKTVYPLIFAIIPTVLYTVYRDEFSNKLSLYAVIFFMFNLYFFTEALLLRRQQIALFFIALLLLLLNEKEICSQKKSLLYLIFTASLVVSHYSVSINWILMIIFVSLIWLILAIFTNKVQSCGFRKNVLSRMITVLEQRLPLYHITFLIAAFIIWYLYVGFSAFSDIVGVGGTIIEYFDLFTDASSKSPHILSAMGGGFWDAPIYSQLSRLLQYSAQGFIIIGLISSIYSRGFRKINTPFRIAAMTFIALAIILPFMSIFQNMPRIYFFTLFFLSPCCIEGAYQLYLGANRVYREFQKIIPKNVNDKFIENQNETVRYSLENRTGSRTFYVVLSLFFLIPFFLFNVGLIFEGGGFDEDTSAVAQISSSGILSYGKVDAGYYTLPEVLLGSKIPQYIGDNSQVYADKLLGGELIFTWCSNGRYVPQDLQLPTNSYLFLRSWNIVHCNLKVDSPSGGTHYIDASGLLQDKDYIYSNGYASFYMFA